MTMVCLSTSVPHTNPSPAISEPSSNHSSHVTSPTEGTAALGAELLPVMGETTSKLEKCHLLKSRNAQLEFISY